MVSNGQISMIDKLFKAIRNVCRLSRRKKEGHDPPPPSAMILRKRHPEEKWRGRRGWKVISQLIMRYRVCLMFRRWRSERGSERKGKEKKKKGRQAAPFSAFLSLPVNIVRVQRSVSNRSTLIFPFV